MDVAADRVAKNGLDQLLVLVAHRKRPRAGITLHA